MSQFELNWVGEYIPQAVAENDYLNERLENKDYGIYYSVQFEGNAETYLLQAKIAPEAGKPEWGMLKTAKSGKSTRFERVKRDDSGSQSVGPPSTQGTQAPRGAATDKYLKDMSNTPLLVYNGSLNYAKELGLNLIDNKEDRRKYIEYVKDITDETLRMRDEILNATSEDNS